MTPSLARRFHQRLRCALQRSSASFSPAARRRDARRLSAAVFEHLESRVLLTAYYFQSIASFGSTTGSYPVSTLVEDASGNLFGTTYGGGDANSDGTVFEIVAGSGTITTLAQFNGTNGANPWAGLLIDASGNLFGTTVGGGANDSGAIFELAAGSGTITTLASFNGTNGAEPYGRLVMDASGNLFGATYGGGVNSSGSIFELAAGSGTITTLASFTGGAGGANPIGDLYADASGNLFGTTFGGGDVADDPNGAGFGTVFELPAGSSQIVTLAAFNSTNGSYPVGGLVADASGNLYGTTSGGGANDKGVIFELPQGANGVTALASFDGTNGSTPYSTMIINANGDLFGTTTGGGDAANDGVVFELPAGSGTITTLATFGSQSNGQIPYAGLLADANGNLFGATLYGGSGEGNIFELTPVGPPAMLAFVQQPGLTSVGSPITPAITVEVEDANGHLVVADSSTITLSFLGPDGATLNGTLSVAAIDGVATFSDLSLSSVGTYTLQAADGVLTASTSNAFVITSSLFTVNGNSTMITNGDTTPDATDFTDFGVAPLQSINGSVSRTYTIDNISNQQISLTGNPLVTVTGANAADFIVTTEPASNVGGESTSTFTITFTPSMAGLESAQVSIASNDSSQNPFTFDIQGTGITTTNQSNGLQIATNQTGSGFGAADGQELVVLYTGTLLNGTVFDASSLHGNTSFSLTLGAGQVITGWDDGLVGMKVGETRTLIIPASLGYGTLGSGAVPPNATLIFQVQLLSITGPTLGLSGQGTAIASGDTTLSTTDGTEFGTVTFGKSVSHIFSLSNLAATGTLELIGSKAVTISGPGANQFTITQPTLGNAQTGTFVVTYKPTVNESAVATITIASNDPNSPAFTFTVGGEAPADLSGVFASSLTVPVSLAVGNQLTIPVTLKNSGVDPAKGTINIVAQASPDGTWNATNPTLVTLSNLSVNIAAGASKTINLTATIPADTTLPEGAYTLLVMIQPVSVLDSNAGNNLVSLKGGAAVKLNITPVGPDLQVVLANPKTSLATYVPGDKITIPVTITNDGNQPAVATSKVPIVVQLRASTDGSYSSADPLLAQASLTSTLAPGKSVTLNVAFQLPLTVGAGAFFPTAFIDSSSVVTEFSEDNNTASTANALKVLWEFGAVPGRSGSVPLTFNDADGTQVTLKLAGPGTGALTSDNGGFDVALSGTTAASAFSITTVKTSTPGDNGRFTLEDLIVGNPASSNDHTNIGTISAATTDLAGSITITGAAASLTWGNFAGPNSLSIGASTAKAATAQSVNLTLGSVNDLDLTSAIGIGTLTATDWQNASTISDSITAPWLNRLNITGNKKLTLAGDFMAGLVLTAANGLTAASPTLGSAAIAGSTGANAWSIAGRIGTLAISGTLGTNTQAWTLSDFSSASSLSLGSIINAEISAGGAISTLKSQAWSAGTLTAATLGTLSVTGNFLADLTLTGPAADASTPVLAKATITGSVGTSSWDITGSAGTISIGGTVGTGAGAWELDNLTRAANVTLGDVTNGVIDASGIIATLSAKRWLAGSITAAAINTLKTTGQKGASAFLGDFAANLTLTGPGNASTSPLLGTVTIADQITGGHWNIAGALTSLTALGVQAAWQGTFTGASANISKISLTSGALTDTLNLTANSIGSLTVAGGLANSSIALSQIVSPTVKALGTLTVTGDITASSIRSSGNIGAIRARSLVNSLLFAGVQPTVVALPASDADFVDLTAANLPTIGSLTLTGFPAGSTAAVFTNTDVAAGAIKLVKFPSTNAALIAAGGASGNFGFATRAGVTSYVGPVSGGFFVSPTDSTIP